MKPTTLALLSALLLSLSLMPRQGLYLLASEADFAAELPDFSIYQNLEARKAAFVSYMLPFIRRSHEQILKERTELLQIQARLAASQELTGATQRRFEQLARKYRIRNTATAKETLAALLPKVDLVPVSLTLAQSATESGWGTSRFAREANNLFGIRCFSEGCGVIPKRRPAGHIHEAAKYDSIQAGVDAYIRILNIHPAYAELRALRAQSRRDDSQLNGVVLATGLTFYSTRRQAYVRQIQGMIRTNNLARYGFRG